MITEAKGLQRDSAFILDEINTERIEMLSNSNVFMQKKIHALSPNKYRDLNTKTEIQYYKTKTTTSKYHNAYKYHNQLVNEVQETSHLYFYHPLCTIRQPNYLSIWFDMHSKLFLYVFQMMALSFHIRKLLQIHYQTCCQPYHQY
eukprot:1149173_1